MERCIWRQLRTAQINTGIEFSTVHIVAMFTGISYQNIYRYFYIFRVWKAWLVQGM
jgi:hypothetical protein